MAGAQLDNIPSGRLILPMTREGSEAWALPGKARLPLTSRRAWVTKAEEPPAPALGWRTPAQ